MPRGRKKKVVEETSGASPVEELKQQLAKILGDGEVRTLRDKQQVNVDIIPTGSIGLDSYALGIGGVPRGRIVEIYGPEAGGKTTLCLHIIANALKDPSAVAAFIDAEHAMSPDYAEEVGVDLDRLLFSQPDSGEAAFETIEALCKSGKVSLIVVDYFAALVPRQELEGDLGSLRPGAQARMMSQNLRRLSPLIGKSNTRVVLINQTRSKIGGSGNPETTSGGNALKFFASVRMDIRRIGALKKGDTVYGNRVKVKVVKHKLACPFRFVEFDLIFGHGISWRAEMIDYGVAAGALRKAGSWYSYELGDESERIGQGRDSVTAFIDNNTDKTEAIKKAVSEYLCKK